MAPLILKPKLGKGLQLYLAVFSEAVNIVHIRKEGNTQLPIYYISKALLVLKAHYLSVKKLALALTTASKNLKPYFQGHTIHVLTNFALRQVLQKPNTSGRLLKWTVELSEFDILFQTRATIKGQG